MQKPTALQRLWQGVEARCNSDEGLLDLVKALLAHQPKSDAEKKYIRALAQYVLAKRSFEIYRKRGLMEYRAQYTHAGCYGIGSSPEIDLEIARSNRDDLEKVLALQEGTEAVLRVRKKVGKQLSFHGAYRLLSRNLDICTGV